MAVGKNIKWKKAKEKQYHLSFNIEAVVKNIRGEEDGNFGEENQDFKNWG